MTDNEIIKALECCPQNIKCGECPYSKCDDDRDCMDILMTDALDLINRQKAEINRLEKENNQFADIGKMYSEIKAETIKEFAKRLKKTSYSVFLANLICVVNVENINNLVKEMAGEG